MKKILLITLALGFSCATFAQNLKNFSAITKVQPKGIIQKSVADPNSYTTGINSWKKPENNTVSGLKSTLNKTEIGSSGNLLTVQFSDVRPLSVLPGLNLVTFIHRGGGTHGATVNQQRVAFTTDGGTTFDAFTLNSDPAWNNRYPTGVVFNKTGNTNPLNAFVGYAGPYWTGSSTTDWTGHYLASERLDSTLSHYNYLPFTTVNPSSVTITNMVSCSDQSVHGLFPFIGITTSQAYYTFSYAEVINGTFTAGDSLTWDTVHFRPAFLHHSTDVEGVQLFSWGQAWSEDGNTGYVYFFGVDSLINYNMSVQPIVYKSIDKGLSWTKMPVFDFSTIPAIADSIWPTLANQSMYVPAIFGSEQSGAVDANGDLHIVTIIQGQYSIHEDSLGYTYVYEPRKLYDLYTTTGGWDAKFITYILSAAVSYTDPEAIPSSSGGNAIGWDHRINLARTNDGTKLFAVWNDVVDTVSTPRVSLPDVFAYGWDITDGTFTDVKNFTGLTAYDGDNYWMYVGDRVIETGNNYEIPVTTTLNGANDGAAITHFYLSGIYFSDSDFTTDINESDNNISNVSQNYPNPVNGNTTISVDIRNASDITLSVSNLIGQNVYEVNKGKINAGTHTFTIDCSKLNSGIYFYTVKTSDSSVTRKMIVE